MATKDKSTAAVGATDEINWGYGIRTWDADGRAHNNFQWDLTPGAKTEAPDWRKTPSCGHGLHCNPDGWGDWALLDLCVPGKIIGIVRYDTALAVEIDGGDKIKAPWMEVVMTTRDASPGAVYGFISQRWRAKMAEILAAAAGCLIKFAGGIGAKILDVCDCHLIDPLAMCELLEVHESRAFVGVLVSLLTARRSGLQPSVGMRLATHMHTHSSTHHHWGRCHQ